MWHCGEDITYYNPKLFLYDSISWALSIKPSSSLRTFFSVLCVDVLGRSSRN